MSWADTLTQLDPHWQRCQQGAPRANIRLNELQPRPAQAITQITTGQPTDWAIAARDTLEQRVRRIAADLRYITPLITQLDYPAAGEYGVHRHGNSRDENLNADPGCACCATINRWEPRLEGKDHCNWCATFIKTTSYPPTRNILDLHHRGKDTSIHDAYIDLELAPARAAAEALRKEQLKRNGRRNRRKKGTTP